MRGRRNLENPQDPRDVCAVTCLEKQGEKKRHMVKMQMKKYETKTKGIEFRMKKRHSKQSDKHHVGV